MICDTLDHFSKFQYISHALCVSPSTGNNNNGKVIEIHKKTGTYTTRWHDTRENLSTSAQYFVWDWCEKKEFLCMKNI